MVRFGGFQYLRGFKAGYYLPGFIREQALKLGSGFHYGPAYFGRYFGPNSYWSVD